MQSYTAADNSQTIRQCTTKIDPLFNEILPVVMRDDKTNQINITDHPGNGGECSWEFLAGACCLVLQILILSQTKKCHFPHPFSGLTS